MKGDAAPALAAVVALGVGSQWLAWRLGIPSILLLLGTGLLAGPLLGGLDPDAVLGPLLFPMVSLSVALILFEGGLSLHIHELRQTGKAVRNLCTVGVVAGWAFGSAACHWVAGLDVGLSLLFGAILVVTGPTVIVPLLRQVRPKASVASVTKWEGIVNDPTGAVLAVLMFEVLLHGELHGAGEAIVGGMGTTLLVAGLLAVVAAKALVLMIEAHAIPDFLHNPVTLATVMAVFVASNYLQEESGLAAVTLMGVLMGNQHAAAIRHIVEFKENLRALLIGILFILLSARIGLEQLGRLDARSLAFVAALILVVRPLTILVSTYGTELDWRERVFLAWMAPRGIVAAAVTSVFALRLEQAGRAGADQLVPLVFLVILATVSVYGLTAAPLARALGLGEADPQGTLILGAHRFSRGLARALGSLGIDVVLVDTNWARVSKARMEGLKTYFGSVLSEVMLHRKELDGKGRLLALTANNDVNALACIHLGHVLGREACYQLSPLHAEEEGSRRRTAKHLRGRSLFAEEATYEELARMMAEGAEVKTAPLRDEFPWEKFRDVHGPGVLLLGWVGPKGKFHPALAGSDARPPLGSRVLALVPRAGEAPAADADEDGPEIPGPAPGEELPDG